MLVKRLYFKHDHGFAGGGEITEIVPRLGVSPSQALQLTCSIHLS
jgi:hypothetical protein